MSLTHLAQVSVEGEDDVGGTSYAAPSSSLQRVGSFLGERCKPSLCCMTTMMSVLGEFRVPGFDARTGSDRDQEMTGKSFISSPCNAILGERCTLA